MSQRPPKQYKLLPLFLVDSKTPLPKSSHTLVTRYGANKLELTRKLTSCWLAVTVLEGAMQGGSSTVLLICKLSEPQ